MSVTSDETMVLCRARQTWCALPLEGVRETMRPPVTTQLSGQPLFVTGVALIRGDSTPVVDVGCLIGSDGPPAPTRLVTVGRPPRVVALAFEEVRGLVLLAPQTLHALPPLLAPHGPGAISALGALDTELLLVLQPARIVPAAVWGLLDAARSDAP